MEHASVPSMGTDETQWSTRLFGYTPSIPMFSGTTSKPPRRESLSDAITSAATAVVGLIKGNDSTSAALSPGKRARVSGQYLEHLEKLSHLYELGVLSSDEFEEQKSFALNNIRELNK